MPCYHPLIRVPKFWNGDNELVYKIQKYDDQLNKTYKLKHPTNGIIEVKAQTIKCGSCIGCRLDHSAQWAARLMLELPYHDKAYFVTLTYDDFHLQNGVIIKNVLSEEPCLSYYPDFRTGEALPCYSLRKRDYQLFMKRLRKKFYRVDEEDNLIPIRFYCCGEYGAKTHRPHFHAILFGLDVDDLKPYKRNHLGQMLYTSQKFQSVWSDDNGPIGFAVLADVSWESCAYVSRYIMKKQKGERSHVYEDFNLQPEFSLMSTRPGIAYQYLMDHPEIYDYDQINLSTLKGGIKLKPPRYFDKLFETIDDERLMEVKSNRQDVAEAVTASKLRQTSKSYLEMLAVEEQERKRKITVLGRGRVDDKSGFFSKVCD